jgi:hypothetical protein
MTIASIDDVVEQGIHNAISGVGHLGECVQSRAGVLATHCRRTIVVIGLIAFGFLFRLELLLTIAIALFALGTVSFCIKRAIKAWHVHTAHPNLPITQASADGRNTTADAGPTRGTGPCLDNIAFR